MNRHALCALIAFVFVMGMNSSAHAQEVCRVPGPGNQHAFTQCSAGFEIYVGALFLQRGKSSSAAIITPPTGTPGVVVSANDFSFDFEGSADYLVRYRFNHGWSIEGRYFDTKSDSNFLIPSITSFRVAGIGITILGGGPIDSTASSDLKSAEFNVRKQLTTGLSVLAGFRYFEFNDFIQNNIASAATFTQWSETNELYGAQVGFNYLFVSPDLPLQFNVGMKGGVYSNSAENRFQSTLVAGASDSSRKTALVGEINLTATYFISQNLRLQAGYTFLYLDNVALAGETAAGTTQVPGSTSSPVGFGNVWYHGANLKRWHSDWFYGRCCPKTPAFAPGFFVRAPFAFPATDDGRSSGRTHRDNACRCSLQSVVAAGIAG